MRRTAIALSAAALAATLGACTQQASTSTAPGGTTPNAPKTYSDITALVSGTGSSMQQKKSVTVDIQITGGAASSLPGMSNMHCQVDIGKTSLACDGASAVVITPDAMYVKSPAATNPSKPWIKLSGTGSTSQSLSKSTESLKKITDFKSMLPPGTTITSTAQDQVAGQAATRYDTATDISKAAAQADATSKQTYQTLLDSGVKEVKQTIWIDSNGLPLKATSTTPPMTIMGRRIAETTTTVTYQDWGKPVTITVPPAEQTTQLN